MKKAQSTLEMTFVLLVIIFLAYGLIQILRWSGMDLASRRWASDNALTMGATTDEQLRPEFYRPRRITSVFRY
jgi:hypothetical protein